MQKGIITETFEELISKMNEFEKSNQVFASQVYPIITDKLRWYGIVFYKGSVSTQQKQEKVVSSPTSASSGVSDKPTDKQVKYLTKMKVKVPETKKEATKMIGDYIESQKKENI